MRHGIERQLLARFSGEYRGSCHRQTGNGRLVKEGLPENFFPVVGSLIFHRRTGYLTSLLTQPVEIELTLHRELEILVTSPVSISID